MQTKEKTVREWFEELPEPYRTQAIANTSKTMVNEYADDLLHALSFAFTWSATTEGVNYWAEFYHDLELKINNPHEYKTIMTAKKILDIGNKDKDYLTGKYTLEKLRQTNYPKLYNNLIFKFSLFGTGFIQVYFVAVNTYFIAKEMYLGVTIASFFISLIWTFNVKKVAFGSNKDRLLYTIGATCGSLAGLFSSSFIISIFN